MLETFILGICLGMFVSYVAMRIVVWATLRQIERQGIQIEDLVQKMKEKVQVPVIPARLEEHQGEFFLYRADTGEFIAQGTTAQEITERTDRRIHDRPVMVIEAESAVMERYRATKTVV